MGEKYKNKLMCEIMAQDVLPSLRAFIAKELILEYKMNQIAVAEWLGVSQPAVSQYVRQLRGSRYKEDFIRKEVEAICGKLMKGTENELEADICRLCRMIVENKSGNKL